MRYKRGAYDIKNCYDAIRIPPKDGAAFWREVIPEILGWVGMQEVVRLK